jgi:cobyrinic acid a,c-diamide synthase
MLQGQKAQPQCSGNHLKRICYIDLIQQFPYNHAMRTPRLVLAGAQSGVGKTTVSLAIMSALTRRGLAVQPFKVGPDYIDPAFHTLACNRPSRNLDAWLIPPPDLTTLFLRHAPSDTGSPDDPVDALSVIEGVMGLFDGAGHSPLAGTAHLASLLKAPVALIINASGMALSAAALVSGYAAFRPGGCFQITGSGELEDLRVSGVILNRVSGPKHYALLKSCIEDNTGLPCLGYLPKNAAPPLPERHLGLVPPEERPGLDEFFQQLARMAEDYLDIPALLRLAGTAPTLTATAISAYSTEPEQKGPVDAAGDCFQIADPASKAETCSQIADFASRTRKPSLYLRSMRRSPLIAPRRVPGLRPGTYTRRRSGNRPGVYSYGARPEQNGPVDAVIGQKPYLGVGVARDEAFSFYYQDALDLLEEQGARLLPFSPLRDTRLPDGLDGIYLGGGFPEMFAPRLATNQAFRAHLLEALRRGVPAYAECGGMLYLCASLRCLAEDRTPGQTWPMVGFFPQHAEMTPRLQHFGYVTATLLRDSPLGPKGSQFRAHEFHYARLTDEPESPALLVEKADGTNWTGGLCAGEVFAAFPHLHLCGCPDAARAFLRRCRAYREQRTSP